MSARQGVLLCFLIPPYAGFAYIVLKVALQAVFGEDIAALAPVIAVLLVVPQHALVLRIWNSNREPLLVSTLLAYALLAVMILRWI